MVNERVTIPLDEVEISARTSSGPGGQHANRSRTRIDIVFDVAASTALSETERARIIERLGPVVRVTAEDERSQKRNREAALGRLAEQLRTALHRDPPRRATRPTRGSVERRLAAKRQTSQRKAARHPSDD